jgi:hypothetical protein
VDDLDREAEGWLAAYRRLDRFDDRALQRVRSRVGRSIAAKTPGWVDALAENGEVRATRRGGLSVLLAAAAGMVGTIGLASALAPSLAQRQADADPHAAERSAVAVVASEPVRERPQPAELDPTAAAAHGPTDVVATSGDATAPRRALAPKPGAPAGLPAPGLAPELALIDVADAALRHGDDAGAAAALLRHRQRFPQGQLEVEALGLTAILDCRRAAPGAGADAERYLARHPGSVLAARVRQACTSDATSPTPTDPTKHGQSHADDNR